MSARPAAPARPPLWATLLAGAFALLGLLAYFVTRDPMLLFPAVVAAAVTLLVGALLGRARAKQ